MILNSDKLYKTSAKNAAKDAFSGVNLTYIKQNANLYNTLVALELISRLTKSINTSGL
jgi:hypothetical protein